MTALLNGQPMEVRDRPGQSAADELLAAELAARHKVADAAKAARVSKLTVYRRLRDPEFSAMVQQIRGEMVSDAVGWPTRWPNR